ncbi:MAG: 3-phosphoshikimate 1-carboxyvinyltransferase [Bacteroidia bacterium]
MSMEQSSQFASALLMIAPCIGKRITLDLIGQPVSKGYFELTVGLMQDLDISIQQLQNMLIIEPFNRDQKTMVATVEADWSAVSYFIALSRVTNQQLRIHNVNQQSLQPDQDILNFARHIGVDFTFDSTTFVLSPVESFEYPQSLNRDYTNCPDIALTEIVLCYALNIDLNAKGIDHLKFKESNRAIVIHDELSNFSSDLPSFNTHNDHRVAMSLTTLSILKPIEFDDINVVSKSFPDFWQEVSKLGINLTQ